MIHRVTEKRRRFSFFGTLCQYVRDIGASKSLNEEKSVENVEKIRALSEKKGERGLGGREFEKARSATVTLFSISASSLLFPGRLPAPGIAPIPGAPRVRLPSLDFFNFVTGSRCFFLSFLDARSLYLRYAVRADFNYFSIIARMHTRTHTQMRN